MMFSCDVRDCSYQSTNKYDLNKHKLYHSKTKNYVCPSCRKLFTTSSDLKRHERIHDTKTTYQCSFENCSFATKRSDSLALHEKTHTSIETRLQYPCPNCGKHFSSHQITSRHLKTCEMALERKSENSDLECKICNKIFSSKSKMQVHVKNHNGDLEFSCHFCDKRFASNYGLKKHLMTHEKTFECKYCNKMFSRKDNLDKHMKTNHESVANVIVDYICSFCQKTFTSSEELMKHFEASTACNEGCQEHSLYQEVVECDSASNPNEAPNQSTKISSCDTASPGNQILFVRNVINQELIFIDQPVLFLKSSN